MPDDAPHSTPHGSASPGDPDALGPAADPGHGEGRAPGGGFGGTTLRRARHGRMLGGVCAGAAESFGVDVTLVRVAAVVFAIAGGLAVPIYIALWLLVPEEGTEHTILSNVVRGPRPQVATATADAVNAQGGAMAPCPRSDDHDWSQAGPYRNWYGGWRFGGWQDSGQTMRVGDTERNQVSDLLSKHYSAGRLDDEEFNQRMTQAVGAKTRADLSGLLGDLPPVEPAPGSVQRHRHRYGFGSFLMLCLTVLVVGSIASALWWTPGPHFGWIALAVIAFFLLRWERHRHWHRAHES